MVDTQIKHNTSEGSINLDLANQGNNYSSGEKNNSENEFEVTESSDTQNKKGSSIVNPKSRGINIIYRINREI